MTSLDSRFWKLTTIFFMLIAIGAVGYYAWELRHPDKIAGVGNPRKINTDTSRAPNPSPASKTQLNQFVDGKDWIMGINVIRVDFRENTRSTTYRYYKDAAVEEGWKEYLASGKRAPLFGSNESNNQRLVNLINGQFSCVRTLDTVAGQVIPVINQYSLATCMAPIPPGYGDFVGFINVFTRRQPTGAEIEQLEAETKQIAMDIYQRDVVKSVKSFNDPLN